MNGVTYGGVLIYRDRPQDLFVATEAAPQEEVSRRGKGGAPMKAEDAFVREMVRVAVLDGFDTRLELTKHMKEWCSTTYGDKAPSDRSIERWVERWCPAEIPRG